MCVCVCVAMFWFFLRCFAPTFTCGTMVHFLGSQRVCGAIRGTSKSWTLAHWRKIKRLQQNLWRSHTLIDMVWSDASEKRRSSKNRSLLVGQHWMDTQIQETTIQTQKKILTDVGKAKRFISNRCLFFASDFCRGVCQHVFLIVWNIDEVVHKGLWIQAGFHFPRDAIWNSGPSKTQGPKKKNDSDCWLVATCDL